MYQLFRSPTTPWLTFRVRNRSTSCVAPWRSSASRLTTVTACGMLIAGASIAVPVTDTVTSSKRPPRRSTVFSEASAPASIVTACSLRSNPASVKLTR